MGKYTSETFSIPKVKDMDELNVIREKFGDENIKKLTTVIDPESFQPHAFCEIMRNGHVAGHFVVAIALSE